MQTVDKVCLSNKLMYIKKVHQLIFMLSLFSAGYSWTLSLFYAPLPLFFRGTVGHFPCSMPRFRFFPGHSWALSLFYAPLPLFFRGTVGHFPCFMPRFRSFSGVQLGTFLVLCPASALFLGHSWALSLFYAPLPLLISSVLHQKK